jgi:hypothetical protein
MKESTALMPLSQMKDDSHRIQQKSPTPTPAERSQEIIQMSEEGWV